MPAPRISLTIALLGLAPTAALACPVCFNAREASRLAFLWTAILMTVLPLGLIGGTIYWLWRRARDGAGPGAGDEGATSSGSSGSRRGR